MSAPTSHLPSRVLGRYAMYEQFAAGGMATLHFGRLLGPSGFSRTVAIKRLHSHLSEDPDFTAMFLDEARLAARIHHPNVIQTLDVESSDGELFVVLNYVHGDSLSHLVREATRVGAPATPAIVGTILFGALEGLHAAHEARDAKGDPLQVVHRDVSPHNILVGTDGIARVLDFGVAKARGRAQTTRVGQLKGKLAYMAPEQLRGKVTRRSDVFSASVVLWEALTGVRLFRGDDEGEVVNNILHESIPPPRRHAPHVTPELEAVVMRGLEREPSRRYPTAREMAIALERNVTLATPIEVGAFVERIGGAKLAQRAARVAVIETECGDAIGAGHESDATADLGSPRPRAMSVTGATSPTVAVPGLARANDATTIDVITVPVATTVDTASDLSAPRRRRLVRTASVASLIGAVAALGLGLVMSAGTRSPERPERSVAAASQTAPSDPSILLSSSGNASVSADSSDAPGPPEADTPPADTSAKRLPVLRPRQRQGCSPPYTIDARGVRHYKPECI